MKIILASRSGVRKKILDKYHIANEVVPSNVDEDEVKISLLAERATPLLISKNLAEIKSVKVSKEDAATLNSVLEDLNPDNRKRMEEELKKDVKSYKSMLTFAKRTG